MKIDLDDEPLVKLITKGETPAKKNSKQIVYNKSSGKPLIISSKRFSAWHKINYEQLMKQRTIQFTEEDKLFIKIDFYHADNRRRDADNGVNSIFDLLVDLNIISDDRWQVIPQHLVTNFKCNKNDERCEISIYCYE